MVGASSPPVAVSNTTAMRPFASIDAAQRGHPTHRCGVQIIMHERFLCPRSIDPICVGQGLARPLENCVRQSYCLSKGPGTATHFANENSLFPRPTTAHTSTCHYQLTFHHLDDLPLVATKASTPLRLLPLSCSTSKLSLLALRHTFSTTSLHPLVVPSTKELERLLFLSPNPPADQLDQKLPHKGHSAVLPLVEEESRERPRSAQSFSFAPFKPP